MTGRGWPVYHSGPCHRCSLCGGTDCYIYNDNNPEHMILHVCARGCDDLGWASRASTDPARWAA